MCFQARHASACAEVTSKKIGDAPDQPPIKSYIPSTSTAKYGMHDPRQHAITDDVIMLVAVDLMPLSLVESPRFRALMERADARYTLSSRKHLTPKLLRQKHASVHSQILQQLKQVQSICLTIDTWSSRQTKSFIGITGHYILDWTMKSVMLDCKRFKGRHTAENIYQQFHETVSAFDIASKIMNIVTDNAANMVKAFKVNPPGYTCVAMESDISDDTDSSDDDDDDDDDDTSDDICDSPIDPAVFNHLPAERDSCFAHTSQLVVHDGL